MKAIKHMVAVVESQLTLEAPIGAQIIDDTPGKYCRADTPWFVDE